MPKVSPKESDVCQNSRLEVSFPFVTEVILCQTPNRLVAITNSMQVKIFLFAPGSLGGSITLILLYVVNVIPQNKRLNVYHPWYILT